MNGIYCSHPVGWYIGGVSEPRTRWSPREVEGLEITTGFEIFMRAGQKTDHSSEEVGIDWRVRTVRMCSGRKDGQLGRISIMVLISIKKGRTAGLTTRGTSFHSDRASP